MQLKWTAKAVSDRKRRSAASLLGAFPADDEESDETPAALASGSSSIDDTGAAESIEDDGRAKKGRSSDGLRSERMESERLQEEGNKLAEVS